MKLSNSICIFFAIVGFTSLSSIACNSSSESVMMPRYGAQSQVCDTTTTNEIFDRNSNRTPSFPGGDAALMRFISENIVYPAEAVKNNIEGKVVVQLLIDKTGKVSEIKVVRSAGEDLDKEAVRVMKLLPDFSPGYNFIKGEPIDMWYTLPVTFKLQGEDTEGAE